MAQQDNDAVADGVKVHDLVNLASPSCTGPSFYVPQIPSAHNLFFHTIGASRYLFVPTLQPDNLRQVHIVNATDPMNPTSSLPGPNLTSHRAHTALPPRFVRVRPTTSLSRT